MRQQYESEADRASEDAVIAEFERAWNVVALKLPKPYRLDYVIGRDRVAKAVVEVKCRNIASTDFGSIIISHAKWCVGMRYAHNGLPFVLAFRLSDGVFWHRADTAGTYHVERNGGRTVQQRDAGDVEDVVHIPTVHLKRLHG